MNHPERSHDCGRAALRRWNYGVERAVDFRCPDCGALYKLVRVLKPEVNKHECRSVLCVYCNRPLSEGDDDFLLKYLMIQKPPGKDPKASWSS